jgi:LysM repeat protein
MRFQTMTTMTDGEEWVAGPVNSAGWLTGSLDSTPAVEDGAAYRVTAGSLHDARRADSGVAGRRAMGRTRRVSRARRLRRVRVGVLSSAVQAPLDGSDYTRPGPDTEPRVESVQLDYRMGRWARLALAVTVLAAIVVVAVSLTAGSAAVPALVDVTVAPGDTLWSIATKAAPDRDPRVVIQEIKQLNDVPGEVLPIGVVLRVPASAP